VFESMYNYAIITKKLGIDSVRVSQREISNVSPILPVENTFSSRLLGQHIYSTAILLTLVIQSDPIMSLKMFTVGLKRSPHPLRDVYFNAANKLMDTGMKMMLEDLEKAIDSELRQMPDGSCEASVSEVALDLLRISDFLHLPSWGWLKEMDQKLKYYQQILGEKEVVPLRYISTLFSNSSKFPLMLKRIERAVEERELDKEKKM
jgi:hypothetical protein